MFEAQAQSTFMADVTDVAVPYSNLSQAQACAMKTRLLARKFAPKLASNPNNPYSYTQSRSGSSLVLLSKAGPRSQLV